MQNLFNSCPEDHVWDPVTQTCVKKTLRQTVEETAKYTGKYPKLFRKGQEFRKEANQYLKDFDLGVSLKHMPTDYDKTVKQNLQEKKKAYKEQFKELEKVNKIGSRYLKKIDPKYLDYTVGGLEDYGQYIDPYTKAYLMSKPDYKPEEEKTLNPYSILNTRQGYSAIRDARNKGKISQREWRNYLENYGGRKFDPLRYDLTPEQQKGWEEAWGKPGEMTDFTNKIGNLINTTMQGLSLGSMFMGSPTATTLSGSFRNSAPGLGNIIGRNITTRGKNFWDATKKGWNTPIPGTKVLTPNMLTTGLFGGAAAMNLADPNSESRKNLQKAIDNPTAQNIAEATATTGIDALNIATAGAGKAVSNIARPLDKIIKFGANKFDDLGYKAIDKLNPAFGQMLRNKNITPTKLGLTGGLGAAIASSDEDTQNAALAGLPVIVSGKTFPVSTLKNTKYPISDKFVKNIFGAMGMYPSSKASEISKEMVDFMGPQFGGLVFGGGFENLQKQIANIHLPNFLSKYSGANEKQILKDVANIFQGPGVRGEAIRKQLQQMAFLDAMRSRPEVFNRMLLDQQFGKQGTFLDLADLYDQSKNWQYFEKKLGKELASSFAGLGQNVKGQPRFDLIKEFIQKNQLNKALPLNQKEATAIYGYQGLVDSEINALLRGSPLTALTNMGKRIPVEGSTAEAITNFLPKLTRDLKSAIGKQPPLQQSRSLLRGEKADYFVEVMTTQGDRMTKKLSDVDPGDVIFRRDFTSGSLLPENFLQTSPRNLYEAPYQSQFGPISSEFILPKGTKTIFFPSQRFGNIFTREDEILFNPDKNKYRVINNFAKNMKQLAETDINKALQQEELITDKILPHYQFEVIPRAKGGRLKPKNIPMYYNFRGTRINSDNTSLPFRYGGNMYRHGGHMYDLFTHGTYATGGMLGKPCGPGQFRNWLGICVSTGSSEYLNEDGSPRYTGKVETIVEDSPTYVNNMGKTIFGLGDRTDIMNFRRKGPYAGYLKSHKTKVNMTGNDGQNYNINSFERYDNGGNLKSRPNSIAAKPS